MFRPVYSYCYQSTFRSALPREERCAVEIGCLHGRDVSIRAPARGAIEGSGQEGEGSGVSIRAPARGAIRNCASSRASPNRFDPRSRARSDPRATVCEWRPRSFDPRSRARSDASAVNPSLANFLSLPKRIRKSAETGSTGAENSFVVPNILRPIDFRLRLCRLSNGIRRGAKICSASQSDVNVVPLGIFLPRELLIKMVIFPEVLKMG
jgi:hypothetical protein